MSSYAGVMPIRKMGIKSYLLDNTGDFDEIWRKVSGTCPEIKLSTDPTTRKVCISDEPDVWCFLYSAFVIVSKKHAVTFVVYAALHHHAHSRARRAILATGTGFVVV